MSVVQINQIRFWRYREKKYYFVVLERDETPNEHYWKIRWITSPTTISQQHQYKIDSWLRHYTEIENESV